MRRLALTFSGAFALALVALVGSSDGSAGTPSNETLPQATPITSRAMPHVASPVDFALPNGCALTEGGQAVRTGENGSVIHWIAACQGTNPADMAPVFGAELIKQGWTQTAVGQLVVYRRSDLELLFEFVAPSHPPTNYVWFAERYWR